MRSSMAFVGIPVTAATSVPSSITASSYHILSSSLSSTTCKSGLTTATKSFNRTRSSNIVHSYSFHKSSFCGDSSSYSRRNNNKRIDVSHHHHQPCEMKISSNDFRTGTTIELEGIPFRVLEFLHVKPGKGAAFVRTKLKNMKTGNNVDKTFKAGEMVSTAQLEKMTMQHTYVDGKDFVFMNTETFDEERMRLAQLGEDIVKFLSIGQEVEVLKHNEDVIGVELPKTLVFTVTETEPGVKGNTAQGSVLKPAKIETGAEIMVPLFISTGEQIRISTEDGKYLGRSNE